MNEVAATDALARALAGYDHDTGGFFMERFFGCALSFEGDVSMVSLEIEEFMFNSAGSLHGGVVAFLLDTAAGSLFKRANGQGYTLESKTQYLRPVGLGKALCKARFLKRGRLVSFMEAILSSADGAPAAIATSTWQSANGAQLPSERRP